MAVNRVWAFEWHFNGLPDALITSCMVGLAGADAEDPQVQFQAIWDTGATNSAITQNVVDKCGLKPIGRTLVWHAGVDEQPEEADVYLVNLLLPNGLVVQDVSVTRGAFAGGDVLIGMDVINLGDLTITHTEHQTTLTFQYPPQAEIEASEG